MTTTISNLVASALKWMKREAQVGLLAFSLLIEPAPASRPRVTQWGTYYGKTYEKFRKAAKPLAEAFEGLPTDKPVVVLLDTVCTKPKTGKLDYPRGDVDNYAKGPLDAMTQAKKFWNDDNQVVGLAVFKRYAKPGETPGIYATWFELEN